MSLFRALVGVVIETAKLPLDVALDIVAAPVDTDPGRGIGHRTRDRLEQIKEEADEAKS